jgi:hypothetical protein
MPFYYFGQVDFDMSSVNGVAFLMVEYGTFDWSF